MILRIKLYCVVGSFGLVAVGAIYAARSSPVFEVTSIRVQGLEDSGVGNTINPAEFIAQVKSQIRQGGGITQWVDSTNYFFWPKEIRLPQSSVIGVTVKKRLFSHSLELIAEVRRPYGVWCFEVVDRDALSCVWFDARDGVVLESVANPEGQLITRINQRDGTFPSTGKPLLPPAQFQNVKTVVEGIKALGISVRTIEFSGVIQELSVTTKEETFLKFSTRIAYAPQAFSALAQIIQKTPLAAIEYIDLTVENKIYLKTK